MQEGRCATAAAFRLRERLSKGFAASLGWAVTGSRVFGVAEPRQSRASRSHTHPPRMARGATVAWHPHPQPARGCLVLPRGVWEQGGVLPGAGGWHCDPTTLPRPLTPDQGVSAGATVSPHRPPGTHARPPWRDPGTSRGLLAAGAGCQHPVTLPRALRPPRE